MRPFYLLMAVLGTILPWAFFGNWFFHQGLSPLAFLKAIFPNAAASAFTADVILSSIVFWVWSFVDARRQRITSWWLVLPAGALVGLSLSLPLYLYLREDRLCEENA